METTTQAVIENLKLANNGYTYSDSIPREYRAKLAELVETGTVIKRTKRHPCRPRMTTEIYIIAADYQAVTEAMRSPA